MRTVAIESLEAPNGINIVQLGSDNTNCPDNADAICQQKYDFTIDPQELCELDGNYTATFQVGCHPSVANTPLCPATATQAPLSISALLDSEDLCTIVQGKIVSSFELLKIEY